MISIEVTIPKLKKKVFVSTDESAKIQDLERKLSELLKIKEEMFLIDAFDMEMLDLNMTVEEAGFTNATQLIYISNNM